jgi:malic enzyme
MCAPRCATYSAPAPPSKATPGVAAPVLALAPNCVCSLDFAARGQYSNVLRFGTLACAVLVLGVTTVTAQLATAASAAADSLTAPQQRFSARQ